jgi:hypothetical protein
MDGETCTFLGGIGYIVFTREDVLTSQECM